jgi:hypothetical protein
VARYNKIFLGPATEVTPQVRELIADVAILPGRLMVITAGKWALAAATTVGKVWIAQDNYLQLKGVDTAWDDESTVIGMELQTDCLYAARIANGVNITAIGTALTPGATGTLAIAAASDLVVAYAEEVYNNNSGSEQLIRVRPAGLSYLAAA